jgi:hypothetical protein
MTKYAYKPSSSLSKHNKRRREINNELAKKKLLNVCYTSSTEIESTEKLRKHIKRKHFNSSSSEVLPNDFQKEKQTLKTHLCNFYFYVLQLLLIGKYFYLFFTCIIYVFR